MEFLCVVSIPSHCLVPCTSFSHDGAGGHSAKAPEGTSPVSGAGAGVGAGAGAGAGVGAEGSSEAAVLSPKSSSGNSVRPPPSTLSELELRRAVRSPEGDAAETKDVPETQTVATQSAAAAPETSKADDAVPATDRTPAATEGESKVDAEAVRPDDLQVDVVAPEAKPAVGDDEGSDAAVLGAPPTPLSHITHAPSQQSIRRAISWSGPEKDDDSSDSDTPANEEPAEHVGQPTSPITPPVLSPEGILMERFDVKAHLQELLEGPVLHEEIGSPQWLSNADATQFTVIFRVWKKEYIRRVLLHLTVRCGIGGTDPPLPQCGEVVVLPVELGRPEKDVMMELKSRVHPQDSAGDVADQFTAAEIGSQQFVEPIVRNIRASAELSFDYVMLIVVASMLAAVGLATDNAVVIVASMLVSPLMGPILAITFGTFIFDLNLVWTGIKAEFIGLALCVIIGFLAGIAMGKWANDDLFDWPNPQMEDRGLVASLWLGLAVAMPSGIGVALSILGSNTASLVGVAISASLLPPLVNAGMLWAHAALGEARHDDRVVTSSYLAGLGINSFLLTALNIVCIYISALLMLKIKEATPIPGKSVLFKATKAVRALHVRTKQTGIVPDVNRVSLDALREAQQVFSNLIATDRALGAHSHRTVTSKPVRRSGFPTPRPVPVQAEEPEDGGHSSLMELFPEEVAKIEAEAKSRVHFRVSPTLSRAQVARLRRSLSAFEA